MRIGIAKKKDRYTGKFFVLVGTKGSWYMTSYPVKPTKEEVKEDFTNSKRRFININRTKS